MKIIFSGPPGSGKGTCIDSILKKYKYSINTVSTGNIIRSFVKKNKNIEIEKKINQGNFVSDNLVFKLVKKKIYENNSLFKIILIDGFPRNIGQTNLLIREKISIHAIIELNSSISVLKKRILGRMIHEKSGRIYHRIFNPPKTPGRDNITKEPLKIRKDDSAKIFEKRIQEYYKFTKPAVDFLYLFFKRKKNNIYYFNINTNDSIPFVEHKITGIIKNLLKK